MQKFLNFALMSMQNVISTFSLTSKQNIEISTFRVGSMQNSENSTFCIVIYPSYPGLWQQNCSWWNFNFSDVYIETLSRQTPASKFQKDRQKLRLSTAENVKQMYQHYCHRKWVKIESTMLELINTAAVAGISNVSRPELHISQNNALQSMNVSDVTDWSDNCFIECYRGNWRKMQDKLHSLNIFIRLEDHIIPNIHWTHPKKKFTYWDSFSSHGEPSSDCDLDLMTLHDLDCLPLDWFLEVNQDL